MWYFEGFCRTMKPKYCCLIDVGTKPDDTGILKYYLNLEANPKCGGVAGFMGLYFD